MGSLGGHAHEFVRPEDAWSAWNLAELFVLGAIAVGLFTAGRRTRRHHVSPWRLRCTLIALAVVAAAIASPLDGLAGALASAHMVQHVLLILVAAPLLVAGAPVFASLAAAARPSRVALARVARKPLVKGVGRFALSAVVAWLVHAAALWAWHSAALYDAALRYDPVHALEHLTFIGTAMLFWNVVLARRRARRVPAPAAVLVVFTMGLQSVFLSALLTFAPTPWYEGYAVSARVWGLDPLTDQQLAGLVMWIPAGFVYFGIAVGLLTRWLQAAEREGEVAGRSRPAPVEAAAVRS